MSTCRSGHRKRTWRRRARRRSQSRRRSRRSARRSRSSKRTRPLEHPDTATASWSRMRRRRHRVLKGRGLAPRMTWAEMHWKASGTARGLEVGPAWGRTQQLRKWDHEFWVIGAEENGLRVRALREQTSTRALCFEVPLGFPIPPQVHCTNLLCEGFWTQMRVRRPSIEQSAAAPWGIFEEHRDTIYWEYTVHVSWKYKFIILSQTGIEEN